MSWYYKLSTYTNCYFKSITQLKDKSRNVKCLGDMKCFVNNTRNTNKGYVKNNVAKNMSQKEHKIYHYVKAGGSTHFSDSKEDITKSRFHLSGKVRKGAQELFMNLQRRLLKTKLKTLWKIGPGMTIKAARDDKPEMHMESIPEQPSAPPLALEDAEKILNPLNAFAFSSWFASLNLDDSLVVGLAGNCFDSICFTFGLKWWAATKLGTLIIKFLLFRVQKAIKNAESRKDNHLPQLQMLQIKMQKAQEGGDRNEVEKCFHEGKAADPFEAIISL